MVKRLLLLLFFAVSMHGQTIRVAVDATEVPRKIFHAHMNIPVAAGAMKLAYAKWIPGEHGPTGPIVDLVDVNFTANGTRVPWQRDAVNMYVFNLDVPKGVTEIEADATYLAPTDPRTFTAGLSTTENLGILAWNTLLLFPLGKDANDVFVEATLRMPEGWSAASALKQTGGKYERASLATYIDSPVILGRYMKTIDIPSGSAPQHRINIVADSRAALETPPTFAADYGRLVAEAGAAFGAYHFRKYDWLVTLSDHVAHFGLEHHESSDNRREEDVLSTPETRRGLGGLLSHEYAHSWNGKYRRPVIQLSPDFQKPMEGNLLWVYEGLTEYMSGILATRSGLWSQDFYREQLAAIAAGFDIQPGRAWRPLQDTATAAQIIFQSSESGRSVRRAADFYTEGVLLWLETDAIIREKTNGRASMDDFTRKFHGGETGFPAVKPYTFDDVINTLNSIAPYDWRTHFETRLNAVGTRAPIAGITADGWQLAFDENENAFTGASAKRTKSLDLTWSLGMTLKDDGSIRDTIRGLPADKAGIGPGMKIIAVNGRKFTKEMLVTAVREAKNAQEPIELLVENGDFYHTRAVDYHGGLRYPHLVLIQGKEDRLATVLQSRAAK
jgi:predicted metalloprotease with PDZ domain